MKSSLQRSVSKALTNIESYAKRDAKRSPGVPKALQRLATGRTKCIKKSGPNKGECTSEVWVPFWRHLVDFMCHFGAHWISNGRSAWCFSMYLVQPHKLNKSCFFVNLTTKTGKCEPLKNIKRTKVQCTRRFSMF